MTETAPKIGHGRKMLTRQGNGKEEAGPPGAGEGYRPRRGSYPSIVNTG